ncbi:MAG: TIGR01212 family radical SAM protein [Peptococcaceae bacterium]|nr:TIGR01212 family radical SAM protein [Peptococcaceae bacterium]
MRKDWGQLPYQSLNFYLKEKYGKKVHKVAVNGGFTCPNRDGSKSRQGCAFCGGDGAGECAGAVTDAIGLQMAKEMDRLEKRDGARKFIAYFQAFTNTYAPPEELRRKYSEALADPRVAVLAVATRPDCVDPPVAELLREFAAEREVWVELGLQTIHESTAQAINRCYPLADYDRALELLDGAGIKTVTHLIFGLPGETREMMLDSVRYVAAAGSWGVKFHLLHIIRDTAFAMEYLAGRLPVLSEEAYLELVVSALRYLRPDMTVHRLTAEAPANILLAPKWCIYKRQVLNRLQKLLRESGAYQGQYWWPEEEGQR